MHDIDELIFRKRKDSYLNISSPSSCSTYSYARCTPDSLAPTPSPSSHVLQSTVYQIANDSGDYTIVQPHYSQAEYVTDPSTSSTSTQKVAIISNDIVSQALTLSHTQNKN
ncbi:unnamed protein product [Acanthoscelides obtectus]|uniref:Uncharacterized protein n=1 Tax=Acanthoscelides obtectus TaxID=200917 RepID=A0A9P0KII6_ACAOB|nr:unnamed protein product [Acanthoscelides obtectus]CAK1640973.1 hypothetical protein AOBTE_LOCUS12050 [Acanthoscelides obtectus]